MTLTGTGAHALRSGRGAAAGLCLLLACAWPAQAQPTDRPRETDRRIRQEREAIDRVLRGQTSAMEVLEGIEADLGRKTQRLKTLDSLLQGQQRELGQAVEAAGEAAAALGRGREALAGRVRALYRWGRAGTPFVLLNGDFSVIELMRRKRRLEAVLHRDRELVRGLSRDLRRSRDLRNDVEARRRKLSEERDTVAALRADLKEERARKRRSLADLEKELQRARRRLDQLIADAGKQRPGSESDETAAGGRPDDRAVASAPDRTADPVHETEDPRADKGRAVASAPGVPAAGCLELPVRGRIVSRFGAHKHPELNLVVHRPGIDIAAPAGAEVCAMDRGRVLDIDRLPGYGRILVIEHGRRYHTVYGRLSELDKAVGDRVERGERIAWVGERGSSGESRLYFEMRKNRKPVDPFPRSDRSARRRRR